MKYVFTFIYLLLFSTHSSKAQERAFAPLRERRLALVIGNNTYPNVSSPLLNAVNDANDIANLLKGFGFEVMFFTNLSKTEFDKKLNDFQKKLNDVDVSFFYYSGHGGQVNSISYLFPNDVRFDSSPEKDLISLDDILINIAPTSKRKNIVIIDACRTNTEKGFLPKGIFVQQGLATPNNIGNTFVGYATKPNTPALDIHPSKIHNGLFTGELITQIIRNPSLGLRTIFDGTTSEVKQLSSESQVPTRFDVTDGEFYFQKPEVISPKPIDVEIPCTASCKSDEFFSRASQSGIGLSNSSAKDNAISKTLRNLGQSIKLNLKSVTAEYLNQNLTNTTQEEKRKIIDIITNIVDVDLSGFEVICERRIERLNNKNGIEYEYFICGQIPKKENIKQNDMKKKLLERQKKGELPDSLNIKEISKFILDRFDH